LFELDSKGFEGLLSLGDTRARIGPMM
jgi:hypothetical protein